MQFGCFIKNQHTVRFFIQHKRQHKHSDTQHTLRLPVVVCAPGSCCRRQGQAATAFYPTRSFFSVFRKDCLRSQLSAKLIQSKLLHAVYLRSVILSSSHVSQCSPNISLGQLHVSDQTVLFHCPLPCLLYALPM